ncbi:24325_t:CDS:1, partial [Dentiscutata erythropus]
LLDKNCQMLQQFLKTILHLCETTFQDTSELTSTMSSESLNSYKSTNNDEDDYKNNIKLENDIELENNIELDKNNIELENNIELDKNNIEFDKTKKNQDSQDEDIDYSDIEPENLSND